MNWTEAVERTVTALGYDLVETERSTGGLLRVYIDRLPGRDYDTGVGEFVTVDDCEKVTRQLQHVLEVEGCAYERLEVSSPGLDRPLQREADYERFVGEQVALTLKLPFQGRKKFQGVLQRVDDVAQPALPVAAEAGLELATVPQPPLWRLVLDVEPRAAKRAGGKVAAKKTGSRGSAGVVGSGLNALLPGAEHAAATDATPQQALDFAINEVREARLVPVVDFKGRRFVPQQHEQAPDAASVGEPAAGDQEDGGRDK